jgi:hypothetical protein
MSSLSLSVLAIDYVEVTKNTAHEITEASSISFQNTGSVTVFIDNIPIVPCGHKGYNGSNIGLINQRFNIRFATINQFINLIAEMQECVCDGPRVTIETMAIKGVKTIEY